MTRITVENVSCYHWLDTAKTQRVTALDDVSLKVSDGGALALLGPSGSGKTTLLRVIAGLEKPDSGRVFYEDKPLQEVPKRERHIGMIFQNYALIPHWESEKTIGFFLRLRGRQREIPDRVRDIAKITGVSINDLLKKQPRQLSGGEKQRVAIARAFARDLRLLLLDEPFANLDSSQRTQARLEVRRLLDKFSITTILSTHDQQEAAALADRIVLLREGRIEQVGTYQSLFVDPSNRFVAAFIGVPTMNFFEGVAQDDRWQHRVFGGYPLPVTLPHNAPVTLGIRPEHIAIHSDDDPANSDFTAIVDESTSYYAERYTLLEAHMIQADVIFTIQVPLHTPYQPGDTVRCTLHDDALFFFDGRTGERLIADPYGHP